MRYVFDVDMVRAEFPALSREVDGHKCIYLDGPGGSQVPRRVVEKIVEYLLHHNANAHGPFITSEETDNMTQEARETLAAFLNCHADEVAFGESSSGNLFKVATALCRTWTPGDEVLITDIDHESNRSPWRLLEEFGAVVRRVRVDADTLSLDFDDFKTKLNSKTKIVALNWASNATGTVTDVRRYIDAARKFGALTVVDAVHYAAHKPIDVQAIGADILVCSGYKFFGPHLGVVYIKREAMRGLRTLRVLVEATEHAPECIENGTPNFENICGITEAVKFIAALGEKYARYYAEELQDLAGLRRAIVAGMLAIEEYEAELVAALVKGLSEISDLVLYCPPPETPRTSTVSFSVKGRSATEVGAYLGRQGIFAWTGHFYARTLVNEVLGLEDTGGLVRLGLEPYNTLDEVERTITAIKTYCIRA